MYLHPIQMEAAQQYPWSFFMVIKTGQLPRLHLLNRGEGGGGGLMTNYFFPWKGGGIIRGRGLIWEGGGLNGGFMVHVDYFIIAMKCYTF